MTSRPTGFPRLDLGPESGDHLSIRVLPGRRPLGADGGDWLVCPVRVHVGGFSGDVAAALRPEELHRFGEALRTVRQGLRRTAVLESSQEWLDLTVTLEEDGTLTVGGHLNDDPGAGGRLRFRLERLDPAQMDTWIEACAAVDAMVAA